MRKLLLGLTLVGISAALWFAAPAQLTATARGYGVRLLPAALRDGHGIDLQSAVHDDMVRAFSAYPALWGLARPDPNIDHRRVPNLATYFTRQGWSLPAPIDDPTVYRPGDIVTWDLGPGRPHIGFVSARPGPGGRPLILHNVGAGTRLDDFLFAYPVTGHFRLEGG